VVRSSVVKPAPGAAAGCGLPGRPGGDARRRVHPTHDQPGGHARRDANGAAHRPGIRLASQAGPPTATGVPGAGHLHHVELVRLAAVPAGAAGPRRGVGRRPDRSPDRPGHHRRQRPGRRPDQVLRPAHDPAAGGHGYAGRHRGRGGAGRIILGRGGAAAGRQRRRRDRSARPASLPAPGDPLGAAGHGGLGGLAGLQRRRDRRATGARLDRPRPVAGGRVCGRRAGDAAGAAAAAGPATPVRARRRDRRPAGGHQGGVRRPGAPGGGVARQPTPPADTGSHRPKDPTLHTIIR
jgi:hypothetical protein